MPSELRRPTAATPQTRWLEQELALFKMMEKYAPGRARWWEASQGSATPGSNFVAAGGTWACRQTGLRLAPVTAGQVPTYQAAGGANGRPAVVANSSLPVGVMVSPAGTNVIPLDQDWTVLAVCRPGNAAPSTVMGVVGNAGSSLALLDRSSNLVQVTHIPSPANANAVNLISVGSIAVAHHLLELSWRQTTPPTQLPTPTPAVGTLTLRLNGAVIGSAAGVTIGNHTGRISVLGAYDVTDGILRQGSAVTVSALHVIPGVHVPSNAEVQAALYALYNARFALGLA